MKDKVEDPLFGAASQFVFFLLRGGLGGIVTIVNYDTSDTIDCVSDTATIVLSLGSLGYVW